MGLSEACCKPAPPCEDAVVLGKEGTLGGLPTYFTGSETASEAVVFVADIFGWKPPLLRKLADKVAAAGYLVVIPDFLKGDPFVVKPGASNYLEGIQDWLPHHQPAEAVAEMKKVVAELKAKGTTAVGLTGFCWGGIEEVVDMSQGYTIVSEAKNVALVGKEPGIWTTIAQMHPSFPEASDYEELKVSSVLVLAAPEDGADKIAKPILAARKDIESHVKIFPGVTHGWTCRYEDKDPEQVKNANEAHKDLIDWLTRFLPITEKPSAGHPRVIEA